MAKIQKVAELAVVSTATVSRAVAGKASVSPAAKVSPRIYLETVIDCYSANSTGRRNTLSMEVSDAQHTRVLGINSMAESFFLMLKNQRVYRQPALAA